MLLRLAVWQRRNKVQCHETDPRWVAACRCIPGWLRLPPPVASRVEEKRSVDKFNQTVSSLTSLRLGLCKKKNSDKRVVFMQKAQLCMYRSFIQGFRILLFKQEGDLKLHLSRPNLSKQTTLLHRQGGNIEFNTATGCMHGKNRGSVSSCSCSIKRWLLPEMNTHTGCRGGRNWSARCYCRKQLHSTFWHGSIYAEQIATVMAFYLFELAVRMMWMLTVYVHLHQRQFLISLCFFRRPCSSFFSLCVFGIVIFLAQVFAFPVTKEDLFPNISTHLHHLNINNICRVGIRSLMQCSVSKCNGSKLHSDEYSETSFHLVHNISHYSSSVTAAVHSNWHIFSNTTNPTHFYDSWDSIIRFTLWSLKTTFRSSEAYFENTFQSWRRFGFT